MRIAIGLSFNFGQKLDQLISVLQKFGYTFDGIYKTKSEKNPKLIGFSKSGKNGGYVYLNNEDINFVCTIAESMFYDLKFHGADKLTIMFKKVR